MLAPLGAFISHDSPAIMRSADFSYWPSRRSANSTTYPAAARAFAVVSSWGQILTPEGMMIFPDDLTMSRILTECWLRLSPFANMWMCRLDSGLAPRHGFAMRYRLSGRCPRPRGAGPLRRCGASWRSPASRSALAARCVRCLPMGRHHFALRSRPRPPAQRLPMGRRYPAGRSRADAEPGPARSLWRLRFGPASRWRSRFHMPEAPTTWLRACGMQDLHLYVRSRFATSHAQIILPLPGCSPTTARPVAWVRLRRFRLCVSAKVKALRI